MSGIKRKIEGNDPDYEDISLAHNNKRSKADEHNGKQYLLSSRQLLNIGTLFFRLVQTLLQLVAAPFLLFNG